MSQGDRVGNPRGKGKLPLQSEQRLRREPGNPRTECGGGECLRVEKGSLKIKNTTNNNNEKFAPNREEVN